MSVNALRGAKVIRNTKGKRPEKSLLVTFILLIITGLVVLTCASFYNASLKGSVLSDVVSQFDVSNDYIQIDYNGKPVKVSALEYAGFFKWMNNKEGVKGYVTVDPVSMSASLAAWKMFLKAVL